MNANAMLALAALMLLALATPARADVYLHSPRGSNDRLDEANRDRNNADRLFDSQNNNRGGYNVGFVYYVQGSIVPIEWTAQHACGNPRNHCEFIMQMTCDAKIRDGTTTNRIPDNPTNCANNDCDLDVEYGRHESYEWYQLCKDRQRNRGLFTANQNLDAPDTTRTRQNPNGARRGYECPEERDYYPWWNPSPWMDIAIHTNDAARCPAYQAESQNVKSRFECQMPRDMQLALRFDKNKNRRRGWLPIQQEPCEKLNWTDPKTNVTVFAKWTEVAAFGIPAPECVPNLYSRWNHLGNVEGGFPATYNWTVPSYVNVSERCVFRLRYNISTGEFNGWANATSIQAGVDWTANKNTTNGEPNTVPARLDVWSKYNLTFAAVNASFTNPGRDDPVQAVQSRDYVFKNNPRVDIFGQNFSSTTGNFRLKLQLAINTNQFGRTFQDRSHRFGIRARPSDVPAEAKIYNVQVRGKRGNIVQVFPGVEYDFIPNRLHVKTDHYVHFQWTGSNTNPDNNDGQGKEGTDRSNIVGLRERNWIENGQVEHDQRATLADNGHWGNSYPSRLNETEFLGLSMDDRIKLAILVPRQIGGEMSQLDDAGTYFDLGPKRVTREGIYHYLCTRNNNFSNRGQKAKIVVSPNDLTSAQVGTQGGRITAGSSLVVDVPAGALSEAHIIDVTSQPSSHSNGYGNSRSDIVSIAPVDLSTTADGSVIIRIPYRTRALYTPHVYRADDVTSKSWQGVSASFSNGVATVHAKKGGSYTVDDALQKGAVAGIVIGCALFIAFSVLGVWYYRRRKLRRSQTNALPLSQISGL